MNTFREFPSRQQPHQIAAKVKKKLTRQLSEVLSDIDSNKTTVITYSRQFDQIFDREYRQRNSRDRQLELPRLFTRLRLNRNASLSIEIVCTSN